MLAQVIAALAVKAAAALPGTPVYTGAPVTAPGDPELLLIDDEGQAQETREVANLAATSWYARGTVPCSVVVQSGDTVAQPQLDRAQALIDTLVTALRADPDLGGLVLRADVADSAAEIVQNEGGSAAIAPLTVTYIGQT